MKKYLQTGQMSLVRFDLHTVYNHWDLLEKNVTLMF